MNHHRNKPTLNKNHIIIIIAPSLELDMITRAVTIFPLTVSMLANCLLKYPLKIAPAQTFLKKNIYRNVYLINLEGKNIA